MESKMKDPDICTERTGTWEPELQGFCQRNFSIIAFEKELVQAIRQAHPQLPKESPLVERLYRLERGRFRLQLTVEAWKALEESSTMKVITQSFGTWHKRRDIGAPRGKSFVVYGVDKSITAEGKCAKKYSGTPKYWTCPSHQPTLKSTTSHVSTAEIRTRWRWKSHFRSRSQHQMQWPRLSSLKELPKTAIDSAVPSHMSPSSGDASNVAV